MEDRIDTRITIANVAPLAISIRREEETDVRQVERHINQLWAKLAERYKDRPAEELLAMTLYQYAKAFVALEAQLPAVQDALEDFESSLDDILLKV